ncbi:MAG: hypothetical protein HRU01_09520 [Myxococcales bacterium]|nr:hypothetical protein [Myxococcales bacterium]
MARRALFAIGLFLILQEGAFRLVFPVPEVVNFHRINYSPKLFRSRDILPATLGHASFTWSSDPDEYEFVHRLNLYGFRDDTWKVEREAGTTRVAFIGDSFVEGFGSDGPNTLPAAFGRRARESGLPVEVLNLGMGGAGPLLYLRLARDAVPLFRPQVLFVVLYENDIVPYNLKKTWGWANFQPEYANRFEPRVLAVLRDRAAGRRVPRRWTASPFAYLASVPDRRNAWSHPEQAEKLREFVHEDIADAMRRGRFNPALALWRRFAFESMNRRSDFRTYLKFFASTVAQHDTELRIVYIPTKSQVTDRYAPYFARFTRMEVGVSFTGRVFQRHARELALVCDALGIPFLDLSPALRELGTETQPLYWDYDDHFRPRGYRATARLVLDWWRETEGRDPPDTKTLH